MNYHQTKDYLYNLTNYGNTYGIDRMRLLLKALNNPETQFPVIHVAGTNGKGSVCAMLEAIYRNNGYKTGLFTSPHLVRLEERIQVNRKCISETEFIKSIEHIKTVADNGDYDNEKLRPSFFEILNAVGFQHFAKERVDIGIIETGLGGCFDSTNIIDPLVSVITSISYDHMEILGDSLASIADAKAGIIKQGRPVVIGPMPVEAEAIIRQIAQKQKAPVFSVEEVYGKDLLDYPLTSLQGKHQRINAAIAVLASLVIKNNFSTDNDISLQALREIDWPGRWQEIKIGPDRVILDCAHNEAGAKALIENLENLIKQEGLKPDIIIGTTGTHRAQAIMPVIAQYAESIILIELKNPKAVDFKTLRASIPKSFTGDITECFIDNLFPSLSSGRKRPSVVTGSIYLIGEIMEKNCIT